MLVAKVINCIENEYNKQKNDDRRIDKQTFFNQYHQSYKEILCNKCVILNFGADSRSLD